MNNKKQIQIRHSIIWRTFSVYHHRLLRQQ